jgi:hypothetical protein
LTFFVGAVVAFIAFMLTFLVKREDLIYSGKLTDDGFDHEKLEIGELEPKKTDENETLLSKQIPQEVNTYS